MKSQDPEAEVPSLDEALLCLVEPDPLLLAESEYGIRQFSQVLPLTQNIQVWCCLPRIPVLTNLCVIHLEQTLWRDSPIILGC